MSQGQLHLVRHGQSTWNAVRRVQGQTAHVPLTALGEQQARQAADKLADSGAKAVYSSDLRRALQTAQPIARALGVIVTQDQDLRERCLGRFEGQDSRDMWAAADAAWADPGWRPPGGESIHDVRDRAHRFLGHLRARASGVPVVVVTHGDTAAVIAGILRGSPADEIPWTELANGEVVTFGAVDP
ncbi:MAG TPA: histidine phosphatase family protein [Trebonia sp.]|jgi:probable phosphoglycerate mutase